MGSCLVFNLDEGELERQGGLLAASLRRFAPKSTHVVAAAPAEKGDPTGYLSGETLRLMRRLNVDLQAVENPIDTSYPIAYKMTAMDVATDADQVTFLDTDIVALGPFDPAESFPAGCFAAAPENWDTYPQNDALWRMIYRSGGARGPQVPSWRMEATHTGQVLWPYYNAGVVSAPANSGFGARWAEAARRIDRNPLIRNKRPWLDQLALPVAVATSGLERRSLPWQAHFRTPKERIDPSSPPTLAHYHRPLTLRREPLLKSVAVDLGRKHPELPTLWAQDDDWRLATGPHQTRPTRRSRKTPIGGVPPAPAQPELVLTGIPRSGTSYLASLLHRLNDCVVLSEPPAVTTGLNLDRYPDWLPVRYQKWRSNILHGVPVLNRVQGDKVVEDTTKADTRDDYLPTVSRPDFLLGSKNNVAYLARIRQIRQGMPATPIIASIRDPVATLASWQKSFPHLENGDFSGLRVCHPKDPWFSPDEARQMRQIHAQKDPLTRRALLWCFLARIMDRERHHLHILRYEDFVVDPERHLRDILSSVPDAPDYEAIAEISPSTPRSKEDQLPEGDADKIRSICGPMAARFGYTL